MRHRTLACVGGTFASACCLSVLLLLCAPKEQSEAAAPPPAGKGRLPVEQLRPRWTVGQSWIVETTTRPIQVAGDPNDLGSGPPLRWQFTVVKREKVAGKECFRVEIKCLDTDERSPVTVLWVDAKALVLRKFQTELLVQGEFRTVTESYDFEDGDSGPVLGPCNALPVDLPLFSSEKRRSPRFSYVATTGTNEAKADELKFSIEVDQQVAPARPGEIRKLLREEVPRGLEAPRVHEVRLKSAEAEVRQLWKPGQPWPAYSDNGHTVSRLIKVLPPPAGK
jgi:hypothetical protein